MGNFLRVLGIILLGSYAIISFCAWDFTAIAYWHIGARIFYAVIVLPLAAILSEELK